MRSSSLSSREYQSRAAGVTGPSPLGAAMYRDWSFLRKLFALAILGAALLMILTTPLHAQSQKNSRFIDVSNNRGGNVLEMVKRREELARSGKTVRIRGYCRSACTILTTLPNACLGPNARIGFHAPRIPNTTIIPPYVDQIMGSYYRAGIRARWFGGWNRSLNMNVITAREYVLLDPQTQICKSIKPSRR